VIDISGLFKFVRCKGRTLLYSALLRNRSKWLKSTALIVLACQLTNVAGFSNSSCPRNNLDCPFMAEIYRLQFSVYFLQSAEFVSIIFPVLFKEIEMTVALKARKHLCLPLWPASAGEPGWGTQQLNRLRKRKVPCSSSQPFPQPQTAVINSTPI
jgi:hypothetical protein